jgi:hypothetical protein
MPDSMLSYRAGYLRQEWWLHVSDISRMSITLRDYRPRAFSRTEIGCEGLVFQADLNVS